VSLKQFSAEGGARSWRQWIDKNPAIAKQLPVEDAVLMQDLPGEVQEHFHKLRRGGLLVKEGSRSERGTRKYFWRVNPEAEAFVMELRERHSGRLPCGHDGFRNPREKDGYECLVCGRELTREEIEGDTDE